MSVNGVCRFVALVICLSCGIAAAGQDEYSDQLADLPVVITASRLKQSPIRAPAAVTIIDRETILASGVRQIVDVLRLVPGVAVGYPQGPWASVAMRGMGEFYGRNLQVLIDGVSVYSPMWSGVEWAELPLSAYDIDRIEIIRGPNAAAYGSNAFFGVINIITRDPATEPRVQATTNLGDGGIFDANVRTSRQGDIWRWRVSAGQRSDNGLEGRPDSSRFTFANLRADGQLNGNDAVLVNVRGGRLVAGQGFDRYASSPMDAKKPHSSDADSASVQLRWTRAESADSEWWAQYYLSQRSYTESVDLSGFATPASLTYPVNFNYDVRREGIEFQQTRRLASRLRAVWGAEWRHDATRSHTYFSKDAWIDTYLTRIFANGEWQFADGWTLHPAAMYEHNSETAGAVSPRLMMTWEMVPGHVVRAGVSSARLTPPTLQKFANVSFQWGPLTVPGNYLSSGQVGDAINRSKEVGYAFELPSWRLTGDMRWFEDYVSGLVRPLPPLKRDFANLDDVHLSGGDLSLHWRPHQGTELRLGLSRTIAYSQATAQNYPASVPKHTVSLFARQVLPQDMEVSANYQRVGATVWLQPDLPVPAYDRLDLRLAKRFRFGNERGEVAVVTQNALGNYQDIYEDTHVITRQRRLCFLQVSVEY